MHRILFVCHGNICRSPMAEFVMKDLVKKAGREEDFQIASRACHRDALGSDTHYGTKEVLSRHQIPYAPRHATLFSKTDYENYDRIFGLDAENMHDLLRLTGNDPLHKVELFMQLVGEKREVADPWYTGDFETTYSDILKGCTALLASFHGR